MWVSRSGVFAGRVNPTEYDTLASQPLDQSFGAADTVGADQDLASVAMSWLMGG